MKKALIPILGLVFLVLIVAGGTFYRVNEIEQVIITQFGEPVGEPINKPGLKIKLPVIQTVRPLDKRILEWDGSPLPPRMTRSLILGQVIEIIEYRNRHF